MTFTEWASETTNRIKADGWSGAVKSGYELYLGGLRRADRIAGRGNPIYEEDWDVLLVLDACRADLMQEVADDYKFVDTGSTRSVAGGSRAWMQHNFVDEYADEMAETAYVTGNPFSEEILRARDFAVLDEVWKYGWDSDLNTIPAGAISDRTIHHHRNQNPDRLIAHYMQPHHPFVPNPMDSGMNRDDLANPEKPVWDRLQEGELEKDEVWKAYRKNLRYVLDEVKVVLSNIDADTVVITADHGNAVGEYDVYGHGDIPLSAVREVPWCVTSATDEGTFESELSPDDTDEDIKTKQRLRDLGYL